MTQITSQLSKSNKQEICIFWADDSLQSISIKDELSLVTKHRRMCRFVGNVHEQHGIESYVPRQGFLPQAAAQPAPGFLLLASFSSCSGPARRPRSRRENELSPFGGGKPWDWPGHEWRWGLWGSRWVLGAIAAARAVLLLSCGCSCLCSCVVNWIEEPVGLRNNLSVCLSSGLCVM